ncbi:Ig-like and fibronectin type-III domain-containing protein 1 [Macrosteles quadrilineatus]|uniref:Ig-like and fibronectin type-III domain-containing protein 1 n=1 Tax=Macrosteles quadrilineatus TaxID=74068 RepID=UPI0023E0BDFB|nr:Ig-like and fibronectin type-III domain-containing protein 1 [Macrosteles quadrilineatus]
MERATVLLLVIVSFTYTVGDGGPRGESSPHPVHVYQGDDALVTCVVRDIGNNSVVWKREDQDTRRWKILTVGHSRVTLDHRISVLHDEGGVVWVLAIKNVKHADSGLYACEVNSNPVVRTYHKLSVLSTDLQPPQVSQPPPVETSDPADVTTNPANHNYTSCCIASNVSTGCLGFCNIQSILDGQTGQDPENCETDFPAIVRCMADGRNHVQCCVDEGVPDICQDVCRGEYTVITDNIKTHFSCSAYTEKTLSCIVYGIEVLPSQPRNVEVEGLSDTSLQVSWLPPLSNADTISQYVVNVTMLRSFDANIAETDTQNSSQAIVTPHTVQITVKVSKQTNNAIVGNLVPLTMYEVTVTAWNENGSSLPANAVRTLTLTPGQVKPVTTAKPPKLPDVRACCVEQGITHGTCLDKLCTIPQSSVAEVTDLMICAPWARQTFSCLANGVDHRPCCRARGLPDLCQDLCSGNVTQLDFSYFKCVKYMSTYSNCLMQGYGVLPSQPSSLRVSNVETNFAIVHWGKPKTLGDTVTHYNLHYRLLQEQEYKMTPKVFSPYVLENLTSDSLYEVYVSAANTHGVGESSQRVVFSTESKLKDASEEESVKDYNVTACCVEAGLSDMCMPICSFDASMTKLKALGGVCASEFSKLLRCGAGGRNHRGCCARRGVPPACLPLCSGVIVESVIVTVSSCVPYIGNIVQCFEEGTGLLPGPVQELHAVYVTDSEVTLTWEPPSDNSNVTDYVIHYNKVDNTSTHETLLKLDNQQNASETSATVRGLDRGALYNIFVVSRNEHGTSLPSSLLLINATKTALPEGGITGVTSPPHSLAVSSHSATYVTISWQPPEFSHPAEPIKYMLYYKTNSDTKYVSINTSVTSHMIDGLRPNTKYIVYVTAISRKGQSLPSETLVAWTDPAFPAFVEPPTVHPINLVVEGSSMTILCIAMGTPMPTISLYISGRLVRQEVTRHMVTVIYNVTRDMDMISCYADNGYGTPMERRRRIVISRKPNLTASGIRMAAPGESVTLECLLDAHPEPKMLFWRDYANRVPVIQGSKYDVNISPMKDEPDRWMMHLTIKSISKEDEGDYYCHAENSFGNDTQPVSVRIRQVNVISNVTQCCIEQNVSSSCQDACSFYLDIDAIIDKPECINEFYKLMKCAADGSDHRSCCAHNGVERGCLDWCRGEPLYSQDSKVCLLSHTKRIMSCFREGRDRLPGPPLNVRVEKIDSHSVMVRWDPPTKNPQTVDMYRVFWRQYGVRIPPQKNDSRVTSMKISGLKEGVTYECVVKAGNTRGTSVLTEPVKFIMDDKYTVILPTTTSDHGQGLMIVGVVLALAVVGAMVMTAVWLVRTKALLGRKSTGAVAFENPSYLREVNMDHIQISHSDVAPVSNGISSSGPHTGWKHEPLHVPAQTEVPPTLYEELKLGQDGAGFKRLKP